VHPLLRRQLQTTFPDATSVPSELASLLRMIDEAYVAADEQRVQLEHELEERKRLEVELQLAEKLRAVGQLAAGIAHEINTPIQFIGDSLGFLTDAFAELERVVAESTGDAAATFAANPDLGYVREHIPPALSRCREGADRVATIVRALKTLAHPTTTDHEPANLNAAIENTLIVVGNELKYIANIELDLRATREVVCNVGEIQQVLLNLIVNACDAIIDRVGELSRGGREARGNLRVSTCDDGPDQVITISDDGGGIPAAIQARIFEPFFTTKPVGKGSGQGLPIARSLIVEHHGGQLTFESKSLRGTTFTIRLPAAGAPAARRRRGTQRSA
jgi:two-component system, NtrC family, sensor kinase